MFRRLILILSVMSLLLCIATAVLWLQSYKIRDGIQWARMEHLRIFQVCRENGLLIIIRREFPEEMREGVEGFVGDPAPRYQQINFWIATPPPDHEWKWGKLHFAEGRDGDGGRLAFITTPFYVPTGLFLIGAFPMFWKIRKTVRTQQRRRRHRCVVCNYNLAGNVSSICPECGTAVSSGFSMTARDDALSDS